MLPPGLAAGSVPDLVEGGPQRDQRFSDLSFPRAKLRCDLGAERLEQCGSGSVRTSAPGRELDPVGAPVGGVRLALHVTASLEPFHIARDRGRGRRHPPCQLGRSDQRRRAEHGIDGELVAVQPGRRLLGSAVAVTWVSDGRSAVRAFPARFLMWRFGAARWMYVVLALPLLTTALAAVSGTLQRPAHGWSALALTFMHHTFVTGALEVNIAEEGAWSGLVQGRLADRHGALGGALRTSPLFVAMHLPLQFAAGWTWPSVVVGVIVLSVMAPFFRYLLGETLVATGGSLLAVGILHAAFNASQQMGYPGEWQFLPAMIILAISVGLVRRSIQGSRPALRH